MLVCVYVCVSSAFAISSSKVRGHLSGRVAVVETLPVMWQLDVRPTDMFTGAVGSVVFLNKYEKNV